MLPKAERRACRPHWWQEAGVGLRAGGHWAYLGKALDGVEGQGWSREKAGSIGRAQEGGRRDEGDRRGGGTRAPETALLAWVEAAARLWVQLVVVILLWEWSQSTQQPEVPKQSRRWEGGVSMWGGDRSQAAGAGSEETAATDRRAPPPRPWCVGAEGKQWSASLSGRLRAGRRDGSLRGPGGSGAVQLCDSGQVPHSAYASSSSLKQKK